MRFNFSRFLNPLASLIKRPRRARKPARARRPLTLEALENRLTPAVFFSDLGATLSIFSDDIPTTDDLELSRDTGDNTLVYTDNSVGGFGTVDTNLVIGVDFTDVDINLGNGTNALTLTNDWDFQVPVVYNGGTGFDSVEGNDNSLNYTMTGPFGGTVDDGLGSLLTFSSTEELIAGSGFDTMFGENLDIIWTVDAVSTYDVGIFPVNFSGMESLQGGTQNDTFNINIASFIDFFGNDGDDNFVMANNVTVIGTIDGGAATVQDTIDYSAAPGVSRLVTLTSSGTGDGYSGTDDLGNSFDNIDNIIGGSDASDALIGLNVDSTWVVDATSTYTEDSSGFTVEFSNFEFLDGGTANDFFHIVATSPLPNPLVINGTDQTPGGTSTIGVICDVTTFTNTLATGDFFFYDDSANAAANTYTLDATTLARTGQSTVTYFNMEEVQLIAGTNTDTINVTTTADSVNTSIFTNAGGDAVNVTTTGTASNVVIVGDLLANNIAIASTGASSVTQVFASAGADIITLSGNGLGSGVGVFASAGTDSITVVATSLGSLTVINGEGNSDTINIGLAPPPAISNLDPIQGEICVHGDANDIGSTFTLSCVASNTLQTGDILNFNDQDSLANDTYELTATTFRRTGVLATAFVHYDTVETVNLNAGTGNDIINVLSTAASVNTHVFANAGTDTVNVLSTGLSSNVDLNGGANNDVYNIQATGTGSITAVNGFGGNDTTNISSDAPANAGNLDGILGEIAVEAGTGTNNRLIVSDFSSAGNVDVQVTNNLITGFAPAAICYLATGGNFNNGANDGIFLIGSNTGTDVFTVTSTLAGSTTRIHGLGGDDSFNVGSTFANNNGNLDLIAGILTTIAGTGTNSLYINDRGAVGTFNYLVDPTQVINNPIGPVRTFAGVFYFGNTPGQEMENLRLDGTDQVNIFDVSPSTTTAIFIDGNLPPPLTPFGDFLRINTAGTTGALLHITGPGMGFWTFTSGHLNVTFESIERFNHVDAMATGAEANATSLPSVRVYDVETGLLKGTVLAFESTYRGGVRVATGDVNGDGIPDLVVTPGSGRVTQVKIFNGAPNGLGQYTFPLLTTFNAFAANFVGGASVAIGDVNNDGVNEIVVGASSGAPAVKAFNGTSLLGVPTALGPSFMAYESTFTGGVNVAVGEVTGGGFGEIVTGRASGTSTVRVFSFSGAAYTMVSSFDAYPGYTGGVSVAVGDFNTDGIGDIIAGAGAGSTQLPYVTVYSGGSFAQINRFLAYDNAFRGGVRVSAKPVGDGLTTQSLIWTAPATSNARAVRRATFTGVNLNPSIVDRFFESANYVKGIYLG